MIKPEQIPDEVFVTFQQAWANPSTLSTKECLAAALNAWPGMKACEEDDLGPACLILPLTTQEK